jgi:hypothetical protein
VRQRPLAGGRWMGRLELHVACPRRLRSEGCRSSDLQFLQSSGDR